MSEEPTPAEAAREHQAAQTRRRRRAGRFVEHPLATGFTVTLGGVLALGLAYAVVSMPNVTMSIILAAFIALGMAPALEWFGRHGIRRGWALAIVVGGFLALVAGIVAVVVPTTVRQLTAVAHAAPGAVQDLTGSAWFQDLQGRLGLDMDTVVDTALAEVTRPESLLAISGGLLQAGTGIVNGVSSAFIIVVITLYLVMSLGTIKAAAVSLLPAYRRERGADLLERITTAVGRSVAGTIVVAAANAAVVLILHLVIGSSVWVLMAILAFFITLIPMIGSLVFLVIGTAGALFISPTAAIVFAIAYFAYVQAEAYVVTPKVMGQAVNVPGVLVIIGAMVGATLFGLLGALLAIPVVGAILIVLRTVVVPRMDARVTDPDLG